MKKRLNVEQIQSELRGGSAFFPGYQGPTSPASPPEEGRENSPQAKPRTTRTPEAKNHESQGTPPGVPLGVSLVPKKPKRPIRQRQPFDIYEDQYQTLRKIADAERSYEKGRSMGQMVREAIDTYLKNHNPSE